MHMPTLTAVDPTAWAGGALILVRHGRPQSPPPHDPDSGPSSGSAPDSDSDSGPAPDPALGAVGRYEASRLGDRLRALVGRVDFVEVSPALRTRQTAARLGFGPGTSRAELSPRAGRVPAPLPGELTGQLTGRGSTTVPEAAADPWGWRPEGGESLRDIRRRVREPLTQWRSVLSRPGACGVLVSHSEVIFVLRTLLEQQWGAFPLAQGRPGRPVHHPATGSALVYLRTPPSSAAPAGVLWRSSVAGLLSPAAPSLRCLDWVRMPGGPRELAAPGSPPPAG